MVKPQRFGAQIFSGCTPGDEITLGGVRSFGRLGRRTKFYRGAGGGGIDVQPGQLWTVRRSSQFRDIE